MKKVSKSESTARRDRSARRAFARARTKLLRRRQSSYAATALAIALGLWAPSVQANTFNVTTLANNGAGSLRQAILDANALSGPDVITFKSGLTGTITLTSSHLKIRDSVDIRGPGSDIVSVSANNASRVFYLYSSNEIDVSIAGLTITEGVASSGAGIVNYGENLTLDDVVLIDNTASDRGGGLWTSGPEMDVLIKNSKITGNFATRDGGGIHSYDAGGSFVVENTEISNNSAGDDGGAIYVRKTAGPLTLAYTEISGNAASDSGGGVSLYFPQDAVNIDNCSIVGNAAGGVGGGLYLRSMSGSEPLTLSNTTIAENTADHSAGAILDTRDTPLVIDTCTIAKNVAVDSGGGLFLSSGAGSVIRHSTISHNEAGGVGQGLACFSATLAIHHTVISDNGGPADTDPDLVGQGALFLSYSLIEDATGANIIDIEGNIFGVSAKFGALKNNGGIGPTLIPASDSPALDAGDPNLAPTPAFDQRGMPRVFNEGIDIGAVERNPGTIALELSTTSIGEAAGPVSVKATRTAGADGDVSVDYATTANTATSPADFTDASGTLSWAEGDATTKTISVTLIDDELVETSESFAVDISNITGDAVLETLTQNVVSITDDDAAPTISAIDDLSIEENHSTSPIAFTVSDTDTNVATLTASGSSSNTPLVANTDIVFGGSGANRTVTVTPVTGQFGTATLTITVSDGANTATEAFTLTVTEETGGGTGTSGGDTTGGTATGGTTAGDTTGTSGGDTNGGDTNGGNTTGTTGGATTGATNTNTTGGGNSNTSGGGNNGSANAGNGGGESNGGESTSNANGGNNGPSHSTGDKEDAGTDTDGGANRGCSVATPTSSSSGFSFSALLGLLGMMSWRRRRANRSASSDRSA